MPQPDSNLIKRPHQKESWTEQQIIELARCSQDPKHFLKEHVWIQHPTKGRVKFELFDYQEELIDIYNDYRYSINMLGRQMGKSTCAGGYLLWYAMFVPDSTILVAAHKHTGAQEIMQRIRFMYENLPDFIRSGVTSYNKGSIEFDNGSRIVSATTTENTGRGMSLTLIYLDEFAFVPPRIAIEFWTSISPTLSTGGKCIITSTPNQDDDQFARIWKLATKTTDEYGNDKDVGVNGFKHIMFTWNHHPERTPDWAEQERNKIGEERFRREHNCEFIVADETLVSPVKLITMSGVEPTFKIGQTRWYKKPEKNNTYVIGWDPSLGTGGDPAAIQVLELPSMVQVAEWQHNKSDVQTQLRVLVDIARYLEQEAELTASNLFWSVENNTLGEAALVSIREYGEERIPGQFLTEPGQKRRGFHTTNKSKITACMKFKQYVEQDKILIRSKSLVREVKNFVAAGAGFAAKSGETDDLVMAMLLCVRMVQVMVNWDQSLFDKLTDQIEQENTVMPMPIAIL